MLAVPSPKDGPVHSDVCLDDDGDVNALMSTAQLEEQLNIFYARAEATKKLPKIQKEKQTSEGNTPYVEAHNKKPPSGQPYCFRSLSTTAFAPKFAAAFSSEGVTGMDVDLPFRGIKPWCAPQYASPPSGL